MTLRKRKHAEGKVTAAGDRLEHKSGLEGQALARQYGEEKDKVVEDTEVVRIM